MRIVRHRSSSLCLSFFASIAALAAGLAVPAQAAGFGSNVGIGFEVNNTCAAGVCPPAPTPGNSSYVLPYSFVVTQPNGDRFRIMGSSGVGSDSVGFNCGGSQNFSVTYIGNAANGVSQASTLTINGLWNCATTAPSVNTTHPFSAVFSADVPGSSSITTSAVYNGQSFPQRGPFLASGGPVAVTDFKNIPTSGTFQSNTTYSISFAAGTPIGATIYAGYATIVPGKVVSSVLPAARTSSKSGNAYPTITAFATIINADSTTATSCSLSLPSEVPGTFLFQTTSPTTNAPVGTPNTPVDIGANQSQTFYFAITPTAAYSADVPIHANCLSKGSAAPLPSVNTLALTASDTPLTDMVSIGVTLSGDGTIALPSTTGTQVFATATLNIGAPGSVTVAPTDTAFGQPARNLPVAMTICQTNNQGACMQTPAPSATITPANNQSATFTIFATGQGTAIPFDPSKNRLFVYLKQAGAVVGATSGAIKTP